MYIHIHVCVCMCVCLYSLYFLSIKEEDGAFNILQPMHNYKSNIVYIVYTHLKTLL